MTEKLSALLCSTPDRVDYSAYHDEALYREEQEKIFHGRTWSYVGLEAEVPGAGDFKSTFIGDTPVVLCRDNDGQLHCWVNRCAHKGALVCRTPRGNARDGAFVCVYHQWTYNSAGQLTGIPYRRGLYGSGGMPAGFDMSAHHLQALRVKSIAGMVFASFSAQAPELETFLGEAMCRNIRRILHKPIRILGYARQAMAGNWKLYSENSRDSYHGGLLHLFYTTFGIYRPTQDSEGEIDAQHGFHNLFTIRKPQQGMTDALHKQEAQRELKGSAELKDPRVIEYLPDIGDGITLSIQSLFPSVVLQQILNTLATRQLLTKGVNESELVWTYFGYSDDSEEMNRHRLRSGNLVGPAGYISMEDGEAVEICQQGTEGAANRRSLIQMGAATESVKVAPLGLDENAVRGFWRGYFSLMR